MNNTAFKQDDRANNAYTWAISQLGLSEAEFCPASTDASFRRYFRLTGTGRSWIVMDAPPHVEKCTQFLRVGALMREAGIHVPEVMAMDLKRGYLLLSDLGNCTYLEMLDPDNADTLYHDAICALIGWQGSTRQGELPDYTEQLLREELSLFPRWYLECHLGIALDSEDRAQLSMVFEQLIKAAMAQPHVFVHRDYMPRNLMLSDPNPGVLDFQDAVYGPIAYDPICLFKDAFISWPEERVIGWLAKYHAAARVAALPVGEWRSFRRDCDWIGLHRHLKVLGIFARIFYRDGKSKYLADTPRFIGYVTDVLPRYQEFGPLRSLFSRHVLPRLGA